VRRMVVRQGVGLAGIGIGAGLIIAIWASRLMDSLLYGVSSRDPVTYGPRRRNASDRRGTGELATGPARCRGGPGHGAAPGLTMDVPPRHCSTARMAGFPREVHL
jgi:hypothetical protein